MFLCSLRYFANVALFPKTPGRPSILAKGRSDTLCKIKETLLIRQLKATLNDIGSEKLYLCSLYANFSQRLILLLLISHLFNYYLDLVVSSIHKSHF